MSLYGNLSTDTTFVPPPPKTKDHTAGKEEKKIVPPITESIIPRRDNGLKLLQQQLALKKAHTNVQKDKVRTPIAKTKVDIVQAPIVTDLRANTIDQESAPLKPRSRFDAFPSTSSSSTKEIIHPINASAEPPAKKSLLNKRKPVQVAALPLSFLPSQPKEEAAILFNEYKTIDEYDPMKPNDYQIEWAKKEIQKRVKKEEQRKREADERRKKLEERERNKDKYEAEAEDAKRKMGAAIAPPQSLLVADSKKLAEPDPSSEKYKSIFGGGLGAAEKMMAKMGYKKGSGLGAKGQGMTQALKVDKIGYNAGKIVHENEQRNTFDTDNQEQGNSITDLLKNPTKVVLLKNVVGRGEVDAELDPEIREEMSKFGEVKGLVIQERQGQCPDDDAVRIYVQFGTVDQAIKSTVALNGRFFGGRLVQVAFFDQDRFENYEFDE